LATNRTQLRRQLEQLQERLHGAGEPVTRQELLAVTDLLAGILERVDQDEARLGRRLRELDARLFTLENSRVFQIARLPGAWLRDWRGRLGQWLLHSPLHPVYLRLRPVKPTADDPYQAWLAHEPQPQVRPIPDGPLISVVLPVHNPKREWLEAAVDSVARQSYGRWQLCVCDDASRDAWVAEHFSRLSVAEPRIRFVRSERNLGIAGATNRAGELAQGEYVGFLDQDDVLSEHALFCVAEAAGDRRPDLLYSDEDYLEESGRRVQPSFKPAFSPDLLHCCMYMGHFLVVRKARLDALGWLRSPFDGSQDYDLALRVVEDSGFVRHIPRILYHWRRHPNSTAANAAAKPFTQDAGYRALCEVVSRQCSQARVENGTLTNTYHVLWPAPPELKASVVICSRNARLLGRCLRAIERNTAHANREIIVVAHREGNTAAMDRLLDSSGCLRVPYAGPFHFSAMNNLGAARATGEVLVFLNDDVEPLTVGWLGALVAHAHRRHAGVVGAKLLYPCGALQHAGIVTGIMDGVGHPGRHLFAAPHWNWMFFTRNVSAVTGACLAIRKELFEALGGFDEAFPVNYNDVDLCLRARQAGYEVIFESTAVLRHDECRTRQPGVRLEERERWEERWGSWIERGDPYYSPYLTRSREDASLELNPPGDLSPRPAGSPPTPPAVRSASHTSPPAAPPPPRGSVPPSRFAAAPAGSSEF